MIRETTGETDRDQDSHQKSATTLSYRRPGVRLCERIRTPRTIGGSD